MYVNNQLTKCKCGSYPTIKSEGICSRGNSKYILKCPNCKIQQAEFKPLGDAIGDWNSESNSQRLIRDMADIR